MAGTLTDERFDVVEALQSYAAERGITLLDVAIGALAAQPAVGSVIAGATSPEQVKANVAAAEWIPSARGPDRARQDRAEQAPAVLRAASALSRRGRAPRAAPR